METETLAVAGACTRSIDAQISANGQFFEQSTGGCCSSGQHGMSSVDAASAEAEAISMPGIETSAEDAIALSAMLVLTGPRMTPSIAKTQSRRWKAAIHFIPLCSHANLAEESVLTKICASSDIRDACCIWQSALASGLLLPPGVLKDESLAGVSGFPQRYRSGLVVGFPQLSCP
ncbi:hypothetical protein [Rhizobium gallicum]|uniref:hypothetical protein n=1 Tax=Rhizobium gallicum TaxID=56730 RepID=UPI0012EC4997|nr:hypothetical protein [Rhizobium gallicum]